MQSLQLIRNIITEKKLENCKFNFCIHNAKINWRQENNTVNKKIQNIESGIRYNELHMISKYGKEILAINDINTLLYNKELISVSSQISNGSVENHILMMNLHPAEELTLDSIIDVVGKLTDERFWIIKTDRYYHIYTNEVANKDRWMEWNINFLMLDCMVSPRYIGYSLRDGFNLLRLSATECIKTKIPEVIFDSNSG